MVSKETVLRKLSEEIEIAKSYGLPQFAMGLLRAQELVDSLREGEPNE